MHMQNKSNNSEQSKNFKFLNNFDDVSIVLKRSFFCLNIALTLNANNLSSDHFVKKWKKGKRKENLYATLEIYYWIE